jgi:transcriptional regulator with XRE-family HTH domain
LRDTLTTMTQCESMPVATMTTAQIHKGKQPNRPHFIREWAEHRGFHKQADLAKALEADKSVVSRWYKGTSPTEDWQNKLAALFHCEPESLFRHPDDDWFTKFFRNRQRDELDRMRKMLEAAFPPSRKSA